MSRKIITLSGRQGSGKTEFAKIATEKYGFTKIAIADRLKEVVAELYHIPLNNLIDPILKQQELSKPWLWNKDTALRLEKITGVNLTLDIEEQEFKKPREALQYIGTDVIRQVDQDFHIKECIKKVNNITNNVIIDDQRFPSEKDALQRFNPIEYFIIRPYYFTYSNHESEISLNRTLFKNNLINKESLTTFKKSISWILNSLFSKQHDKYHNIDYWLDLLKKYNTTNNIANAIGCSRDKVVYWFRKHGIDIKKELYTYDHNAFLNLNTATAYIVGYIAGDGCVKPSGNAKYAHVLDLSSTDYKPIHQLKELVKSNKPIYEKTCDTLYKKNQHSYYFVVASPYIVEDLKLWDIVPRTTTKYKNTIPNIIKSDKRLLNSWIAGLIDADGTIYRSCQKYKDSIAIYPAISVLASEPVIDFIKNYWNLGGSKNREKDTDLYVLKYHGMAAKQIYQELRSEYVLDRKWDKIKDLI